jgi:hypothetical protein
MDWYQLVKLVHFMGLIALFGFFVLASRGGGRLRAATTRSEARPWLALLEVARPMLPSGVVMLALSGALMAWFRWRGAYPFIVVGLVSALLIWAVWAFVGARHLRAIAAAMGDTDGPITGPLAELIRDPRRWAVWGSMNGAALGVLAVMTLKLGWLGSIAVLFIITVIVGTAFAVTVRRSRDALTASSVKNAA